MSAQRQSGAAIIMAMLVTALAVVSAAALLVRIDRWVQSVAANRDRVQALELARAAAAYGRAILAEDAARSNIDHLDEDWARRLPAFAAEGGEIEGWIEDMQGRWNLNNLLDGQRVDPVALGVYRRLLGSLGLDPTLADVLADWVDADDEVRPGGAESAYYQALPAPFPAGNSQLDQLYSLRRLKGYDEAVVARLEPFVSVLPGRHEVNVNTAPPEVLAAIQPGLSLAEARNLVFERRRAWFRDGIDFRARLPREDLPSNETAASAGSRYFRIRTIARYGGAEAHLQTLVERDAGGGLPRILWQGEL